MGSPCQFDRVRDFLKKAEDRFTYEMSEKSYEESNFRLRNVKEENIGNEQGGPSYKIMRNFTKTDYQFDFGNMELLSPNSHDSGCLTGDGSPCNIPATQVGGSGWQTLSWAYFREKLRTPRYCLEEFRDIPQATSYLRELKGHLPEITNDRLDMFFRGLEYFYSTKHIYSNQIKEIAAPYTTTQQIEGSVSLLDIGGNLISPSRLTPRIVARIYNRLRDSYGRQQALGFRGNTPFYGMTSSDEIIQYYHVDNPEIFDEIKASDRVNPLITEFGLSQVLGQKIVHIEDRYGYRANINADGTLKHVSPYINTCVDELSGAGFETIHTQEWRQADLEFVSFLGDKQFVVGYQDAFMPVEGKDMKEIGKRFDWRLFNEATCDDEDANWFHYYATSRFYVRPNFRRNLVGFYFPVNPERLDGAFFGNGNCPVEITECNVLPTTCSKTIEIVSCCDHDEANRLLVTFDTDIYTSLGITNGAAGFIRLRDGSVIPVVIQSQSAKSNKTYVINFTASGINSEVCCARGEMLEFFTNAKPASEDTISCSSEVYDAAPSVANFTTYNLFLELPVKCVALDDALTIYFSDGSSMGATATGTYNPVSRVLEVTPATVLTPDKLTQKYITKICCTPTEANGCPGCDILDCVDTPCANIIDSDGDGIPDYIDTDDDNDGTPDVSDFDRLDPNIQVDPEA